MSDILEDLRKPLRLRALGIRAAHVQLFVPYGVYFFIIEIA